MTNDRASPSTTSTTDFEDPLLSFAASGDAEAQYLLGRRFATGLFPDSNPNPTQAATCYRQAAESGYAEAQNALADCYFNGDGVKQDLEKAIEWYAKAAAQGNAHAHYKLALSFMHGWGVAPDDNEAIKRLYRSAEMGLAPAQSMVGFLLEIGLSCDANFEEAVNWYRKAAAQVDTAAQYSLQRCLHDAHDKTETQKTSTEWQAFASTLDHLLKLVAERNLQFVVVNHRGRNHYVQFSLIDSALVVEAVSNVFLEGADQLHNKQYEQLVTIGWHAPDPDGNFHARFNRPFPQVMPTYMMLRALRDVYNIYSASELEITSEPSQ